jgi:molybdopterin-guanine dinucleotide biosynthesis adapter protein
MKVMGIVGWSGSGKTQLVLRLLPELTRRGYIVSTVKHAHHAFDVDTPGKDSYEHRRAGAREVMVSSANRWALMHEHRGAPEAALPDLLARMSPVDLVLVEGFKRQPHDKIEVWRRAVGQPLLATHDPHVVAVASDAPIDGLALPCLDLDDAGAIAEFIIAHEGTASRVA